MTLTHTEPRAALNEASLRSTLAGKEARSYWIGGDRLTAAITNYGARPVALYVPDRDCSPRDVVLGFDNDYRGAIVGRHANRIARGRFSLDGKDYTLAINNPPNHLHGGPSGFSARVWEVVEISPEAIGPRYFSVDGEEGYPGNVALTARYSIEGDTLSLSIEVTTDAPTVLNVCDRAYWNLNGQGSGSAMGHTLFINAGHFTPVDEFSMEDKRGAKNFSNVKNSIFLPKILQIAGFRLRLTFNYHFCRRSRTNPWQHILPR